MYIKSNLSDCGANKLAISANWRSMTGMKNENKKIRKNFFTKIEKRQRSCWRGKGGGGLYSTQQANTGTNRTYRVHIRRLVSYNTRVSWRKGLFAAFRALRSLLFPCAAYFPPWPKYALKTCYLRRTDRRPKKPCQYVTIFAA